MDISALSIAMSTQSVQSDISVAVLSKNLDTLEIAGDGLQKMMEASVTPNIGQNIDYFA